MKFHAYQLLLIVSCIAVAHGANALTVSLAADPKLPAPNILSNDVYRFETGLKGWSNRHSNEVACVAMEGHGLSFFTPGRNRTVWRGVGTKLVRPGHTYILSCDINPSPKVRASALPGGASGLGCSLTYWTKDWKKAVGLTVHGDGPDRWQRISSRPVTIPDWIHHGQLTVGLAYSGGSGYVDNIELVEAYSELTINVASEAAIRQVKVVDQNYRVICDSGVLKGEARVWTRCLRIEAAYTYTVYAVDAKGDVKVAGYPKLKAAAW